MYSASSKICFGLLFLLSAATAFADSGFVTAVATGKDATDATNQALQSVVTKTAKGDAAFVSDVLTKEILPNASHFVTSYKILDGSGAGAVNVEATVDMHAIQALLTLTPKNIGVKEGEAGKITFLFHGPKFSALEAQHVTNYFSALSSEVKDAFQRRKFTLTEKKAEASTTPGEDPFATEVLRSAAQGDQAQLALGIAVTTEMVENENAHGDEERVVLQGTLVDVATGNILAKQSKYFVFPHVLHKEQLGEEFARFLRETTDDLLEALFIQAGDHSAQGMQKDDALILRVLYPPSAQLIAKFRASLEGTKEVKSLTEYRAERGRIDFRVDSSLDLKALKAKLTALKNPEFELALQDDPANDTANVVAVQIKKAVVQPSPAPAKGSSDYDTQSR